jgi:hypothetical protein
MSGKALGTGFRLLARSGETDEELLQRLISYVEETDLEEIIEARW